MRPRDFDLVQPILVPRHGTHEGIIRAVARASHLAHRNGPQAPTWHLWLRQAPAKSVRKVKAPSHLEQVRTWAEDEGVAHALIDGVLALEPTTYEGMHPRVRGSQVHGVDFPPGPTPEDAPTLFEVVLLEGLTTGKAAAQAAHAVWGWHLAKPGSPADAAFTLRFLGPEELRALSDEAAYTVHDGGFTEVSPGTLTALAMGSAAN